MVTVPQKAGNTRGGKACPLVCSQRSRGEVIGDELETPFSNSDAAEKAVSESQGGIDYASRWMVPSRRIRCCGAWAYAMGSTTAGTIPVRIRSYQYLDIVVEQDYRFVKKASRCESGIPACEGSDEHHS
jgi:hypothetical protein